MASRVSYGLLLSFLLLYVLYSLASLPFALRIDDTKIMGKILASPGRGGVHDRLLVGILSGADFFSLSSLRSFVRVDLQLIAAKRSGVVTNPNIPAASLAALIQLSGKDLSCEFFFPGLHSE